MKVKIWFIFIVVVSLLVGCSKIVGPNANQILNTSYMLRSLIE